MDVYQVSSQRRLKTEKKQSSSLRKQNQTKPNCEDAPMIRIISTHARKRFGLATGEKTASRRHRHRNFVLYQVTSHTHILGQCAFLRAFVRHQNLDLTVQPRGKHVPAACETKRQVAQHLLMFPPVKVFGAHVCRHGLARYDLDQPAAYLILQSECPHLLVSCLAKAPTHRNAASRARVAAATGQNLKQAHNTDGLCTLHSPCRCAPPRLHTS